MTLSSQTLELLVSYGLTGQQIVDITALIEEDVKEAICKCAVNKRTVYREAFERFWKEYPTTVNMSKKEAYGPWKNLAKGKMDGAIRAIPAYKEHLRKNPDLPVIHACRFLKYERFTGFNEEADANAVSAETFAKLVFVAVDTPEWNAWVKVKPRNSTIWSEIHHANGWHFPTAFPERASP